MDYVRSYFNTSERLTSSTLLSSLFVQISTDLDTCSLLYFLFTIGWNLFDNWYRLVSLTDLTNLIPDSMIKKYDIFRHVTQAQLICQGNSQIHRFFEFFLNFLKFLKFLNFRSFTLRFSYFAVGISFCCISLCGFHTLR